AGLRYTDDSKEFTRVPSQLLLAPGFLGGGFVGSGYPVDGVTKQDFQEFTGRLVVDWQPELSFTDQTLVYASYSHGYKGGGANPPPIGANPDDLAFPVQPQTYRPEFVDAFEIGTKNTLLDGDLILNATAFYYDYKDYQVSQIVDRTALNENFDSTNWGLELETIWRPVENIRINANLGYLNTSLADGSKSIDVTNRTQGDTNYTLLRPWVQLTSNCIAPTDLIAQILAFGPGTANDILLTVCGGTTILGDLGDPNSQVSRITGIVYDRSKTPNNGAGIYDDLSGNDLPNSPHWTFNIGGQYEFDVIEGWEGAVRADFYYQSESFARVYNTEYDRLKSWTNTNISVTIRNPERGLTLEAYVKNVFDQTPITDTFTNSDDTGLTANIFTLDPRLIGVSLAKSF
ncbi:MAG: TonB-dependent receptor domain-containing protein, partial [Cypionkella sp.]